MSKFIFALSTFYFLVNGIKAWISMFANDFAGVDNFSNTALFCFVVMSISFIFILRHAEK
jgi:hypothetical protein